MNDHFAEKANELGIAAPENRKTVAACLWRGCWHVNLPVLILIIACYGGPILLMKISHPPDASLTTLVGHDPGPFWGLVMFVPLFLLLVVLPVLPAWLWWSFTAPKWRLWALQNVVDWPPLEQSAIKSGLIWPRGSIFNLTEIKSSAQKTLENDLIRYREQHG